VALDISDYKFFVRDVGVSDTELNTLINNIIQEIASYTRIFKYHFSFELLDNIKYYNFNALMQDNQHFDENITTITLGSDTDQDLIDFLIEPKCYNTKTNEVTEDNKIYDQFFALDDILLIEDSNIQSIGSYFKHLRESEYVYKLYNKNAKCDGKSKYKAFCICTIVPNLEHISNDIENVIRPVLIEGLKYYTDTTENAVNVNPDVNQYKKYFNAKNTLMNMYPTRLGYTSKRIMI